MAPLMVCSYASISARTYLVAAALQEDDRVLGSRLVGPERLREPLPEVQFTFRNICYELIFELN